MPITTVTTEKSLDELLNKWAGKLDEAEFSRLRNIALEINSQICAQKKVSSEAK